MNELPKQLETEVIKNKGIYISDTVQNALDKAVILEELPHEKMLAHKLIQEAFYFAKTANYPSGTVLAAAFDLFVAAQYYRSVAHKGWYYCPVGSPTLFYPFTNICPRCMLASKFEYENANKPESGSIGQATSRLLSIFLNHLFEKSGKKFKVYRGSEPIDMLIYDEDNNIVLLAEIKAAPLTTPALAIPSEEITESIGGNDPTPVTKHSSMNHSSLNSSDIFMFIPIIPNDNIYSYRLINLGNANIQDRTWAYKGIQNALDQDHNFFKDYLVFWIEAFESYKANYRVARNGEQFRTNNIFWFTNACGQPFPRPINWPRRTGTGYESVSDGKTSAGMDRTDDIKKGIYQVLKIGAEIKPTQSHFKVKTALISNIHAVRHYDEYLHSLEDVVWTIDKTQKAKKVRDLPEDMNIYNLFDGIISFTQCHIRDEWIEENFVF